VRERNTHRGVRERDTDRERGRMVSIPSRSPQLAKQSEHIFSIFSTFESLNPKHYNSFNEPTVVQKRER
jgi:hypothetical protein